MDIRTRNILEHMLEDALEAVQFASGFDDANLLASSKLHRKAVVMSILNIGELAKNLSHEFKLAHNEIPWRKISGMRDIAAHGYHIMDDDIIWYVVRNFIPRLIYFLESHL